MRRDNKFFFFSAERYPKNVSDPISLLASSRKPCDDRIAFFVSPSGERKCRGSWRFEKRRKKEKEKKETQGTVKLERDRERGKKNGGKRGEPGYRAGGRE